MPDLHRRPVAITYWVATFVLSVLAGVGGAMLGRGVAPDLGSQDEGAAATSGARFLFGVLGFVLGTAAVVALFAGLWMLAWARRRRASAAQRQVRAEEERERHGDLADLLVDEDGAFIDDVSDRQRREAS
ncbi:hypothetical protein PZ938_16375 [Luteipulveratus sp. YIM 133132]|uniref:Uncharacterized protein n=1 Tax=Luteipulveratus flavus TaxID=3031728 RepID=A0ABT6C334_9MICO|nr:MULTISPECIES: hypothetical protein [unclassified Luteipulveratus]MDE9367196.1 hypothetical protein [Luteipulveratus sp. YIM 133132]MDF8263183.1 hypothetical protein [Luteipulveratus sp. YIM 133296]